MRDGRGMGAVLAGSDSYPLPFVRRTAPASRLPPPVGPSTLVAVILGSVMLVLFAVLGWVVFRGGPKE